MASVKIEELSHDAFKPFGTFINMLNPEWESIGDKPIQFFRDMSQLAINHPRSMPSFSICRVEKRPLVIDVSEIHNWTAEGNLPLDADALIHVGPATPNGVVPLDKMRVFRVPRGTFVNIHAGVWHHAPFVYGGADALNMVIVLPERTYANDCKVVEFSKAEQITIEA